MFDSSHEIQVDFKSNTIGFNFVVILELRLTCEMNWYEAAKISSVVVGCTVRVHDFGIPLA